MVFIRAKTPGLKEKVWTMFNDTEIKQFHKGFIELAHYLVSANAVPTLVLYEY